MKRRMLSLLLALVLMLSLFPALSTDASAATVLTDLFNQLVQENQSTISQLFNENNLKLSGSCGKNGSASVQYKIYEVDPNMIKNTSKYSDLKSSLSDFAKKYNLDVDESQAMSGVDFSLDPNQEYYVVKITGTGEMEDYVFGKTTSPWSGKQNIDGHVIDLEELLYAAYIEDGVTNVGNRAFFGQDNLRAVYLGKSVKTIGAKAFESCEKLTVIDFPNNLETIQRRAFYGCDYLTVARMNQCINLKTIEERAFYGCTRLTEVQFPAGLKTIEKFAFAFCHVMGTNQFDIPANLSTLGVGAFAFCSHLGKINEVNIPSGLNYIGDWAFAGCFDIRELTFSSGKQALTIGTGAFLGCRALTTVHFADRVRTINRFAFAACDKLTDVVFGTGNGTKELHINKIGDRAFTSLEATGIEALSAVVQENDGADSDSEAATYMGQALDASYAVSQFTANYGVTPLAQAAFTYAPPAKSSVMPADDAMNSFPEDCVIYYPTQKNNAQAYSEWEAAVDKNGRWNGYQTKAEWDGHYHSYGEPVKVAPTCTEPGYDLYTCTVCGEEKIVETKAPTGHKAKLVKKIAPTCTEDGIAYYTCSNKWCTQPNYTEVLPATKHGEADGYANLKNRKETPADCTHAGSITGVCPDCGATVNAKIPALGHDVSFMTMIQEPTCTQKGIYQGNCIRCNKDVRVEVPALGHTWDEGHMTKRPTQEKDGERTYVCTVCGAMKTEVIPKLNQTVTYDTEVVQPTCTEDGYTLNTGSDGSSYKSDFVDALGHKWDEGKVTTEPTAKEAGEIVYTCKRCGETKTETVPALGTTDFTDIDDSQYYYAPVLWAVSKGITKGATDTTFEPNAGCTRAQAVTFLYRFAGEPTVKGTNKFTDVKKSDYFYNAVLWAVQEGITVGTTDDTFSPGQTCTRAHIVTFLFRMLVQDEDVKLGSEKFKDVGPTDYFYDPVRWAVDNGITVGVSDTKFDPSGTCTRGQIVTFLYRANNIPKA